MPQARGRVKGLLLAAVATVACAGDGSMLSPTGEPLAPAGPTSFGRLQSGVLDATCIECHTAGHHYAVESGLVLDSAVAYQQLVGALPTNATARADGLLRVKPLSPDGSLLYRKLRWDQDYHAPQYGSPMPLGGRSLSVGQLEFIRRWIMAGAPAGGDHVDHTLLEDTTQPTLQPFEPLAPPPAGQGYQLSVDRFPVAAQFERELFVYRRVGNTEDIYVNRIETRMRTNSHHFVIYSIPPGTPAFAVPPHDEVRDIRNRDGSYNLFNMRTMEYHSFFAGSMTTSSDYRFPDGVALNVPANASLDLNSHYVNRTVADLPGEVYANISTIDLAQVQHVARTLFLNNLEISLPPGQRTTVRRTFLVGTRTTVFLLSSHMHKRGERFVIRIAGGARNGVPVYESTDWGHPPILTLDPPVVLELGEGLTSEVTYYNETGRTITFGLTSEDEMGIIFGYAY